MCYQASPPNARRSLWLDANLFNAGLARLASHFPLLAQRKVTKAKGTPCHGLTASLRCSTKSGGLRNSAWPLTKDMSGCGLRTVRAAFHFCLCYSAWQKGMKGQLTSTPSFRSIQDRCVVAASWVGCPQWVRARSAPRNPVL
jgi:hypothetical protein